MTTESFVLDVQNLHVRFPVATDWRGRAVRHAHALNGVSLQIQRGEAFGVVGESGCGKSTLAQVLVGLLSPTSGVLRRLPRADSQPTNVQIVFQDPHSSLDPRLPAWRVIVEPLVVQSRSAQRNTTGSDLWSKTARLHARADELALQVGLRPEQMDRYVHEFSGGQRQRIAIARALSSDPDVIVLDEPTSALDISVQAQILNLLQDLRRARGLTYILISHNISVVRHMCDRIAVMYLGQIVEVGEADEVLRRPQHPYTQLLLDSVPRLGEPFAEGIAVHTELPSNRELPIGCFFRDRCPRATVGCEKPQNLKPIHPDSTHGCRCHLVC